MSRFLVVSDIRFLYAESAKLQLNLRICNINKIHTKCIESMWIRYTYDISNRKHIVSCLRFIRDFDDREHRFGQLEIVARSVVRYGSCQSNQNWSKLLNHINKIYAHVCDVCESRFAPVHTEPPNYRYLHASCLDRSIYTTLCMREITSIKQQRFTFFIYRLDFDVYMALGCWTFDMSSIDERSNQCIDTTKKKHI